MAYEGIEVSGGTVKGILEGFGDFRQMAHRMLAEVGLGTAGPGGEPQLDVNGWYPVERVVALMNGIEKKVGRNTLYQVGIGIAQNVRMPEGDARDILRVLRRMDFGYHLNHRKNGQMMVDPKMGTVVQEGIGHFHAVATPEQNLVTCVYDAIYPCDMARGLLTGLARLAQPSALVKHDNGKPCRKTGGANCTFVITWL